MFTSRSQIHNHHGYTLIEILIAVVILSIGLLGMAGIQLKGMRGTQNSFLRTEAVNLANSMAERMHANPYAAQNIKSALDNQYMAIDSTAITCSNPPTIKLCDEDPNGATATCNISEMAAYDKFTWVCGMVAADGTLKGGVKNELPNGKASVTCIDKDTTDLDNCSPGSTHRITVSWAEGNINPDKDPATKDELVTQSITINTVP